MQKTNLTVNLEKEELGSKCRGSFIYFCETFFQLVTGRHFIIPKPPERESHVVTIAKSLTRAARLEIPDNRLIINVPPGHGKPVHELTKLHKKDNSRVFIKDIEVGDEVLTHHGRFRRVNKIYHQGELPVLKIKTFSGREVVAALDHPFLTVKGWKKAEDLVLNDVLATVVPQEDFGGVVSDEEARLLGYFIGDGCALNGASNITAVDPIEIKDIQHCCHSIGLECNVKLYSLKNKPAHYNQNLSRVNILGAKKWLTETGIIGKNSYSKRVPEKIMLGNKQAAINFLAAYFACDGTYGKKAHERRDFTVSITSVCRELLEDCQHLFLKLGIKTRIRKKVRNQTTKKQGDTYTSYNLEFTSQDDIYHFQQTVSPYIFHEKASLLKSHNFDKTKFDSILMPDPISSIESAGNESCLCIEVEEDHTFTANDIVVHNSTLLSFWVAWTMAHNPKSNFLYITYSKTLATKHTEMIRRIMMLRHYEYLFDVHIKSDSKARDLFGTTAGGSVGAYGSSGSITGQDAGLPGCEDFTGAVIMDDSHKPDEVHSDVIRKRVIDNYSATIMQRVRSDKVPLIYIGQRLHEDDLPAHLLSGADGYIWEQVILKALDDKGRALYPEVFPIEMLSKRQNTDPYVFASQFQQDPIPAGGALFKREWFLMMNEDPKMVATFITADTAETSKSYNDATVFSFWGVYEIEELGEKTGQTGLHWIDCIETRIEPKDLKDTFLQFYQETLRYTPRPSLAAIEKKSTGVTLVSTLSDMRTLQIREIERNSNSGSKTQRFLNAQPFVASKNLSMTAGARHVSNCLNHMVKITANDTHRHDDIADTVADAIHLTFDLRLFALESSESMATLIPESYNSMFT